MRKKKKSNGVSARALMIAFGFLIFIGIGVFIACDIINYLGDDPGFAEYYLWLAVYLLVFYAVYFVHIIVHESGHLVFGLLTGYKFSSFRIGSVIITKENGKLKFAHFSLMGTLGQCLLYPPEEENGKIPYRLYNFGGVIFNFLLAFISFVLYLLFPGIYVLSAAFMVSAVIGLWTAASNGIPMSGLVNNDGYNGISLGRDVHALRSFANQLRVNGRMAKGERLRDMPQELFELSEGADIANPINNTIIVFKCNRLMDEHRFEEVRTLCEKLIENENIMPIYKNMLICDLAFCEMLLGEEERAKSRFNKEQKKFMAAMAKNPSIVRTWYAHALFFEKNTAKAEKYLADFEKIAANYPYSGDTESERELMEEVKKAVNL